MPLLWMAKCTTCDEQGPGAENEYDGKANDWCVEHNASNADHQVIDAHLKHTQSPHTTLHKKSSRIFSLAPSQRSNANLLLITRPSISLLLCLRIC